MESEISGDLKILNRFGDLWTNNVIKNLEEIRLSRSIVELRNKYRDSGASAVIISAGPSLDKNIVELRNIKKRDKFILIATDIAARYASEYAEIDYIISIDAQAAIAEFYSDLKTNAKKILAVTTHNDVVKSCGSGKYFFIPFSSDVKWYFELIEKLTGVNEYLEPGLLVSNTAVSFAQYAGCKRAIMIGNDLGYTGLKIYASGVMNWTRGLTKFDTAETRSIQKIASGTHIYATKDMHSGNKVYTTATYLAALDWLESVNDMKIINATEGGIFRTKGVQTFAKALREAAG